MLIHTECSLTCLASASKKFLGLGLVLGLSLSGLGLMPSWSRYHPWFTYVCAGVSRRARARRTGTTTTHSPQSSRHPRRCRRGAGRRWPHHCRPTTYSASWRGRLARRTDCRTRRTSSSRWSTTSSTCPTPSARHALSSPFVVTCPLLPERGAEYCDEHVCVCLQAYLQNYMSDLHLIFCTRYLPDEVNTRRDRLVLGWVNILGRFTISVCNHPTRSTQPCIPAGSLNRVPASLG